ncbi:MAG: hypothetical protein D6814_08750 [Calditrichaeota bacterium]|nr:MAG: hypothetical protein D6814_08750 [Calditrichota bacterium]
MRYLILALLLATLICTISNCNKVHFAPLSTHGSKGQGKVVVPLLQNKQEWKKLADEIIPLLLASFSYILLPVLAGYFSLRLALTYHRFLFTITGLFVLTVAFILMTGFFNVQIRWEKIWAAFAFLKKQFAAIGWVRAVALILGAYFGVRAYTKDNNH